MCKNHRVVPGDFCAPRNVHFTSVEIHELGNQYSAPLTGYVLSLLYLIFSHFFLTQRMDSLTYGVCDPPITNTRVWDALGRTRVETGLLPTSSSHLGGEEEYGTHGAGRAGEERPPPQAARGGWWVTAPSPLTPTLSWK